MGVGRVLQVLISDVTAGACEQGRTGRSHDMAPEPVQVPVLCAARVASDGGDSADPVRHRSPGHAGVGDEALEAVRGTRVDMEFDGHPGLG